MSLSQSLIQLQELRYLTIKYKYEVYNMNFTDLCKSIGSLTYLRHFHFEFRFRIFIYK